MPQVISAIDGTPAAAAGIEPGDRIVKADGQPIVGLEIGEVVRRLRGRPEPGSCSRSPAPIRRNSTCRSPARSFTSNR